MLHTLLIVRTQTDRLIDGNTGATIVMIQFDSRLRDQRTPVAFDEGQRAGERERERERFTLHNHRKTDDLIDLITGYRWSLDDDDGGKRIETTFSIRTRVSQETDVTTFSLHSSVEFDGHRKLLARDIGILLSLMMGMK